MLFEELPVDLVREVLLRVDGRTLIVFCQLVCKKWHSVIDDVGFWRKKCRQENVIFAEKHTSETVKSIIRVYLLRPFGKNLIKNPSGEEQMRHWEALRGGGEGFIIERPPVYVETDVFPVCFATSFESDIKLQAVDLIKEGCDSKVLDSLKPVITVSEWHAARIDCASTHGLVVHLLKSKQIDNLQRFDLSPWQSTPPDVITRTTFEKFTRVEQWQDGKWIQTVHSFRDYPEGIRVVMFYSIGLDNQFWAGHYGAKMAGASVVVHFD
ncbi:unnamed protein product [Soboliphyme baturini]|uniref:F-box only protein 44-like n=1 Tax=Soboliphyme baturini TaxID=241478 RepID=A0A183J5T1_9BILA|nr:unnamed protein product [Soboliphyme baturini]